MKIPVFNTFVNLLPNYSQWLWQRLETHQGTHIVTLNAEMAILTRNNSQLAKILEKADLIVPDGAGIVFYLRLFGYQHPRCPGIELAESLLRQAGESQKPYLIYFYGAKQEIIDQASQYWLKKFKNLDIKTYNGYLNSEEKTQLLKDLEREKPQIILVGLGVPRQEFWIEQNRHLCPEALWMGVGGSFDIWSGAKIRAPEFFRNNNLEWLYRLYKEPYRWYRMLALPQFFLTSIFYRINKYFNKH